MGEADPTLARRDASHALAIITGGAEPVASGPMLLVVAHRSRLLATISTSPAATLTLRAGLCFGRVPQ